MKNRLLDISEKRNLLKYLYFPGTEKASAGEGQMLIPGLYYCNALRSISYFIVLGGWWTFINMTIYQG